MKIRQEEISLCILVAKICTIRKDWPTMVVMGDVELEFDFGEGVLETATTFKKDSKKIKATQKQCIYASDTHLTNK